MTTSQQSSASFKAAQTALIGYSNNNININNNNKPLTNKPMTSEAPVSTVEETQIHSRSFTFESAGGVRRKIPVTPVLSTAGRRSPAASSSAHDTLHYRLHKNFKIKFPLTQLKIRISIDKGRSFFPRLRLAASSQAG